MRVAPITKRVHVGRWVAVEPAVGRGKLRGNRIVVPVTVAKVATARTRRGARRALRHQQ